MQSHICCDLSRVRMPVAFGRACVHACGEQIGTTLTSDTSVKRFLRLCPSAYKWGIDRDPSQTTTRRSSNTSSDASLFVPTVRPGTPRPLLRLLHPELPPRREKSPAGDWDQTGEGHYPFCHLLENHLRLSSFLFSWKSWMGNFLSTYLVKWLIFQCTNLEIFWV